MAKQIQASSLPLIVANVIIGGRPEPFFASCLASVADGIDFLVLNDNSGNLDNPNLNAYRNSRLFKEGRSTLLTSDLSQLSGFDEARNLCLAETGKRFPNKNVWVLYLDTDEVHTKEFVNLTRNFLPSLSSDVGVVDGYFYQFIQTFDFYYSIDRRHNLLFRYHPDLRWDKPIHSQLQGIRGKRVPTGYLYFHYGYVYTPENVLNRWKLYKEYDSVPFDPSSLRPENLFGGYEKNLIPFRGKHPEALSLYFQANDVQHVSEFTALTRKFLAKNRWCRIWGKIKEGNWRLRLAFRNVQAQWACWQSRREKITTT